ncbi:unnamed protein product [Durusdinium trenchii]
MPHAQVQPNLIIFNSAIACCSAGAAWPHALRLLQVMQTEMLQADVISCSSAISACEKGLQWRKALEVFESMWRSALRLDVICCNSVLSACEKCGQWPQAWQLFHTMAQDELTPVTNSYNALISACAAGNEWQRSLQLLEELGDSGDAISYAAAIASCGGAHWPLGLHLLAQSTTTSSSRGLRRSTRGPRPVCDAVTWATAQSCCVAGSQWHRAVALLDSMEQLRWNFAATNFQVAISACDAAGAADLARQLLRRWPCWSLEGFNSAVSAQRGIYWQQALELLDRAEELQLQLDLITYSAAISACQRHWHCGLELLGRLQREGLTANAVVWTTCLRACVLGEQWQAALDLFEQMQSQKQLTLLAFCDLFSALAERSSVLAATLAEQTELWLLLQLRRATRDGRH